MREWRVVIALAAAVLIGLGALPATSSAATAVSGVWVVPGNNKNTISWEASSGNTHYRIYRSTTDGVTGSLLTTIVSTGTSYVDTTAANGTSYYYSVRGWDGAVESADPVPAMTDTGQTMTNGNHWWDDCSGVLNGTVFVFSGFRNGLFGAFSQTNTINQYDSVSNVASVTPYTMPAPSRYWCGADRSNGSLYLFGGASGDNGATRYSAIHQFNPTAGVTTKLGTLPTNRYQVSARTLADGTVVALGGENGAAYFQSLARFDPLNDVAAPLPSDETTLDYGANGVQTPGMGAIDGNLIISGGKSGTGNAAIGLTKTLTVTFGPLAYFRANQPNIAPNRYGAGVAELNDRYYSLGGATGGTPSTRTAEIDSFDPRAGTWRDEGAALPESRFRVTAHRIKGFIYVMGGNNGSTIGGTFYPDVYRFDPGGQARGTPGAPQFATAPSALNVTPGDHQASLSWTGGTLVDYYRIFRSTTSGALGTLIEEQAGGQDAPATSIVDLAARNCITYYYTVTGIGYDGHETGSTAQVATMGNGVCEAAGLTQYRNDGVT
ncbi:MAG: coagulation factor 5/8 type domain protein, partial [Thermoleophilia bacterium]|nr:coagulation factor 5/8 type domain protein [Thermoleophilia bacterium]